MPYLRYLTLLSFRQQNPDWEIFLYTPQHVSDNIPWGSSEQKFVLDCQDFSDKVESLNIHKVAVDFSTYRVSNDLPEVLKSDFLRYQLLARDGGVWSDMDILYFRPMSHVLNSYPNHRTFYCYAGNWFSIGFLIASSSNPFFNHLATVAKQYINTNFYQSIGSDLFKKLFRDAQNVNQRYSICKPVNLPMSVVYSINSFNIDQLHEDKEPNFPADSIGIHWFAGHEKGGIAQNTFLPDFFPQTLLGRAAKQVADKGLNV